MMRECMLSNNVVLPKNVDQNQFHVLCDKYCDPSTCSNITKDDDLAVIFDLEDEEPFRRLQEYYSVSVNFKAEKARILKIIQNVAQKYNVKEAMLLTTLKEKFQFKSLLVIPPKLIVTSSDVLNKMLGQEV